MRLFFRIFLSSTTFAVICGWTAIEITNNTEEHAGYCNSQNEDVGLLKEGEEKQLGDLCVKVSCSVNENFGEVVYLGCGSISAGPPCRVVEGNLSQPYPECCPTAECT